jgi:hypothetical protein
MPYVFLTFDEIGDLFHCDSASARDRVVENQWERRRWPDGVTRVQVPPEVAHQFMLNYAAEYEQHPIRENDAASFRARTLLMPQSDLALPITILRDKQAGSG